jgi:glycosyltransferase involved in cell wall biosynthesis
MNNLRVAWLLPRSANYWQPTLNQFTQRFPQTTVFAFFWPGHDRSFDNHIQVQQVGENKGNFTNVKAVYDDKIDRLPFSIVSRLFQFKPDIVFANSFGIWTILALLFKFLGQWKVVIAYEGSSPSVDFCNSPARLAMRRIMVRLADACMTNSQRGKTYLIDKLRAEQEYVFAQPYEVPYAKALLLQNQAIEHGEQQHQHPIFLFVGQVITRKGIHLLVEACNVLKQKGLNNYTVLIAGDGAQQEALQTYCQAHQLTEQVKWLGRVDYSQLGYYFQQADVFVMPTLEDTWGVVIHEAMLFGKPVLCSKQAGASELVIEGENGYCFEPENAEVLASLMSRFIENSNLAVAMGQNSKQFVAQHTPDTAAEFLTQVTLSVVNR